MKTFKQTQRAASATLILKLRDTLVEDRYTKKTDEIQYNDSAHAVIKDQGGKFKNTDVQQYIGNFEDVGYLVEENVTAAAMV
jgi:hypothetical protein